MVNNDLIDFPFVDVDKGRGPLEVLQVDVVDDAGVDDDVVLKIIDSFYFVINIIMLS
jgi:hypothetical protein